MRSTTVLTVAAALLTTTVFAQTPSTPPASPGTSGPTGSSNPAVNTQGNAPSSTTTTGTVTVVPLSALEKGANSFTEGQAKSRLEGAGFRDVTGLAKDNDGIWRGKANKDGKSVDVGVDYKGNIASS